jgi:anaerobic selenocysteine-containing dehydrogenase
MKSRREFLKTVAASSALALAGGASGAVAATAVKAAARGARATKGAVKGASANHAGHAADPAEIAKQKKFTADALKVIRDYPLPAGSPMAFTFKPMKAARGRKARGS